MLTVGLFHRQNEILDKLITSGIVNQIDRAATGEEAINRLPDLKPDLILMDVLLHGMTGLEAARWIKEQDPGVKIILTVNSMNHSFIFHGNNPTHDATLAKTSAFQVYAETIRLFRSGNNRR
ncbi:MAG TPA: response regulator [Ohtaekwangia sp.]